MRHSTCTNELCGSQRVNRLRHLKRRPLCQESEAYKRRHLKSIKRIKFIILNCVFLSKSECSWNSSWDISLSNSPVVIILCLHTWTITLDFSKRKMISRLSMKKWWIIDPTNKYKLPLMQLISIDSWISYPPFCKGNKNTNRKNYN